MKSLKELTARNIALSERKLGSEEAEAVLVMLGSAQNEDSKYEVVNCKLRHLTKVTEGLFTREYVNGVNFKRTQRFPNGNIKSELWLDKDGVLHRECEDGPARFWRFESGDNTREEEVWYIHGKEQKAKETGFYENGNKHYEQYSEDRISHREGNPACTYWYRNENKQSEFWYRNGKLSREDGPALTRWHTNGSKELESWYKNGFRYREDQSEPNETFWYENENKGYEAWYNKEGKLHREDAPANIAWKENGMKSQEEWFNNGTLTGRKVF